jgi:hypothetical protein
MNGLPSGGETTMSTLLVPMNGGPSIEIVEAFSKAQWQPDSRFFYLSVYTGMQSAGAYGKTSVLPVPHGKMLPDIPAGGFPSEAAIAALPGVRVIDSAYIAPGASPDAYAFSRQAIHRNLYRVPLR